MKKVLIIAAFGLIGFNNGKRAKIKCMYNATQDSPDVISHFGLMLEGILIDDGKGYKKGQYKYYYVDFGEAIKEKGLDPSWNRRYEEVNPQYCDLPKEN